MALAVAGWAASGAGGQAFALLDDPPTTEPETTAATTTDITTAPETTTDPTTTTTTVTTDSTTTTASADNPPLLTNVPPNVTVEANGPGGSTVNYTKPTAVDDHDGPRPVSCSPDSGSLFALGQTT